MSTSKFLWIPRALTIIFILFLSLFSLDVFSMDGSFLQKAGGFLIHNIPSFLLLIILIISWRRPLLGGIAYLLSGVLFTIYFKTYSEVSAFLFISLPVVIIGALQLVFHFIPKNGSVKHA